MIGGHKTNLKLTQQLKLYIYIYILVIIICTVARVDSSDKKFMSQFFCLLLFRYNLFSLPRIPFQ